MVRLTESSHPQSNRAKSERSAILPPLRLADLPAHYLTCDPGSVHCGVARFERDGDTVRLIESYERSPRALFIELRELRRDGIGLVIAEDFSLRKGQNAQGSRLVTPRVLGVIEYICEQEGVLYREQTPSVKSFVDPWLRSQVSPSRGGGVEVDSLASNVHKRDSIRHGLYPALRDKRDRQTVMLVLSDHDRARGRSRE